MTAVDFTIELNIPPALEALSIARELTHATFTHAKQQALVAALERAVYDGAHPELLNPDVEADEIDEDPPEIEAEKEAAFQRGLELGRQEEVE